MLNMLKLVRFNISLMVLVSCFTGFYISGEHVDYKIVMLLLSILFHSFGNSILNQWQEIIPDSLMKRTQNRPLVKGKISRRRAFLLALFFLSFSFIIPLALNRNIVAVILFFNLIIYNFIYTPLKKITPFALLLGSISGALPPLAGWFFVKDSFQFPIIFISTVFYLWQVPHFLYLSEIYREEYKNAGFKVLINNISSYKYKVIKLMWLSGYFVGVFYSQNFEILKNYWLIQTTLLLILCLLIVDCFFNSVKPKLKFHLINISILLFVISIFRLS